MGDPRFSVIIPSYNSAATLQESITSVLRQDDGDLELLVVDDGSTDHTASVVRSIADRRLRYIFQENRGVSAARNAGIAQARGAIITFLDSDDEAYPGWLSVLGSLLNDEHIGIAFCGLDNCIAGRVCTPRVPEEGLIYSSAVCLFLAGAYAVRRPLLDRAGGFDTRLRISENTELGIRLIIVARELGLATAAVQTPLAVYNAPPLARQAGCSRLEHKLTACDVVLREHSEIFRGDPVAAAGWLASAGVAAARLGRLADARGYFLQAVARRPMAYKNYLRLAAAVDRRVAFLVWKQAPSRTE